MHAWVATTPPGDDELAYIARRLFCLLDRVRPSAPGLAISKFNNPACICTCQRFKCALMDALA
jgi:hypothetical protein